MPKQFQAPSDSRNFRGEPVRVAFASTIKDPITGFEYDYDCYVLVHPTALGPITQLEEVRSFVSLETNQPVDPSDEHYRLMRVDITSNHNSICFDI